MYGGVRALKDVSFSVPTGSVAGLIGPNGAGKTTLFNTVSGLVRPNAGTISWRDIQLLDARPDRLPSIGIGRTFQNTSVSPTLSIIDNVLTGAHSRVGYGVLRTGVRAGLVRRTEANLRQDAIELLDSLGLSGISHRPTSGLPIGILKRVELARALMAKPSLLLLDEPANGLTGREVEELIESLRRVVRGESDDLTLLIVEHNMGLVTKLCQQVVVLNFGEVIAIGRPEEVQMDAAVIEAYLGHGS